MPKAIPKRSPAGWGVGGWSREAEGMVMLNFLADPNCSLDPSRGDGDLGRVEPDGGVSYRNLGVVEGDAG